MRCIYTTLGHPEKPRGMARFGDLLKREPLLQTVPADSREQIQHLLDLMNPGPEGSIIQIGNDVAHRYSCADAREAVDDHEQPLHRMIDLLPEHVGMAVICNTGHADYRRAGNASAQHFTDFGIGTSYGRLSGRGGVKAQA